MKIVLFGTSGRLGRELDIQLSSTDHTIYHPSIDISNTGILLGYLDLMRPDMIINCASITDVDYCEGNPEECYAVNTWPVYHIAGWCNRMGTHLIHCSTNYVFPGGGPYSNSQFGMIHPVNTYGHSKAMGDYYIMNIMEDHSDTWPSYPYTIYRFSCLYGGIGRPSFPDKILGIVRNGGELNIDPDIYTNPTYIPHLATRIVDDIGHGSTGLKHSVSSYTTYYKFARTILDGAGYGGVEIGTNFTMSGVYKPSVKLESSLGAELQDWKLGVAEYIASLED